MERRDRCGRTRRRMNVVPLERGVWDWRRDGRFVEVSIAQRRRKAPRGPREF